MGPRFLDTLLPFLACPLGLALKRFPGPTVALAGVSVATTVVATITHPLVGYETETVVWARLLLEGSFQPTIASAYGLGRGWGGIWPFLLAGGGGLALAIWATPRLALNARSLGAGVLCLLGWALFAALAPTLLRIDHAGLVSIVHAGDRTALEIGPHSAHPTFSTYPLKALAPIAAAVGLLALGLMAALRTRPRRRPRPDRDPPPGEARSSPAPVSSSSSRGEQARTHRRGRVLSWRRPSRASSHRREVLCRRPGTPAGAGCRRSSGPRRSACSRCPRSSHRGRDA